MWKEGGGKGEDGRKGGGERKRERKGGGGEERERYQGGTGMQTPWQNWHFYQELSTFAKKYGRVSKTLLNWVVHGKCYQ